MKYTILHRLGWVDPILDGASHMLWMHLLCSHDIIGLTLVTLPDIRVYRKDPSLFLATYWNLS